MDERVLQGMKKIVHIVGTRPNYVKAAPVISAINFAEQVVINTGQHYDKDLSADVIDSLNMRPPDISFQIPPNLGVFERLSYLINNLSIEIENQAPDFIILYGDVDSTMAAAIVASRMNIPIAHVESGLRSFDDRMPEEINRKIVDRLSSVHFVTEESAIKNLTNEGFVESICFVGNSMIDSLVSVMASDSYKECKFENNEKILLTCHRPSNVDSYESLVEVLEMCKRIRKPVVWPMHPRTMSRIKEFNLIQKFMDVESLEIIGPLDYCSFLKMMATSKLVITDSGGIQEETTFLKVPCLTIRENTERPSTITEGSNMLVTFQQIEDVVKSIYDNNEKPSHIPELWDGKSSERISAHVLSFMENENPKKGD